MLARHAPGRARDDGFEVVPFANEIGQEFSPAISPDSKRIAYTWDGNKDNYDIYIKDVGKGTASRVTHNAAAELNPPGPRMGPGSSFFAWLESGPTS